MKMILLAIPALIVLTGCVIEDLNNAIQSSTYTIYENQDAVQRSNDAIRMNSALVNTSNQGLAENRRLLESVK